MEISKIFKYIIIIVFIIICFVGIKNIVSKNKIEKEILENTVETVSYKEGMSVTILGGSNMEEYGNTNSMG